MSFFNINQNFKRPAPIIKIFSCLDIHAAIMKIIPILAPTEKFAPWLPTTKPRDYYFDKMPHDMKLVFQTRYDVYVLKPLKYEDYVSKIEKLLAYWSINELKNTNERNRTYKSAQNNRAEIDKAYYRKLKQGDDVLNVME